MAAISIIVIDDILIAVKVIIIIATRELVIITIGNFFLGIFLIMLIATFKINIPTPTFIPLKAFATIVISKKLSRKDDMQNIIINYQKIN